MDLLHTLFYFVVAISVLVSIHEFGHFWVARKAGVKVLRFSVGFGKVLWSYQKDPDTTEYVISAIPLGGYVKMVDEREGEVKEADLPYAFNRQSLWARTAIVAAGPVFNLMLAVVLFWSVLVIGETGIKPMVGAVEQGTLAANAGFVDGDEIISVNDKVTPTWTEAMGTLVSLALDGEQSINITVKNTDDQQQVRTLHIAEDDSKNPDELYRRLGFKPWSPKLQPIIGQVLPDSAALAAGLQTGDLIVSADDAVIGDWMQWVGIVKSHPGAPIKLVVERDGVRLPLTITPKSVVVGENTEGKVGASVYIPEELMQSVTVEYALSPLAAIPVAFQTTYFYSVTTLKMMGKMLIGKASVENLSGPISIAQYAGQSATMGLVPFIKYLALISISLGILNLLPIPVLDGGHLLFFAIEGIKGSPVSEKAQIFFQQIGIALLLSLMALAMFLDIGRLFN
ncbi:MAG: RIP metalloprotease RseP [Methylobacter sp.]|nr:RIP metalloprotease RseP [Methylobacter sp.]MDP2429162.1 RIP metalloprotease RseP [Methylobacter sp.]MDP3053391.1 RIP metalloprotease RseP [Methylobacter sp.]MDP3360730.1 RIP metalloprotease RseP [Methylobacter sp.]MDZ4218057.1 RIP metalloprotease RseP [Methylobacter sp.]